MCGWSNGPDGATICQNQGYPRRLQGHDVTASGGQLLFWMQFLHADEDQAAVINPAKVHPAEGNSRASTNIVHADNLISRQRHAQPSRKHYECASRPIPQNGPALGRMPANSRRDILSCTLGALSTSCRDHAPAVATRARRSIVALPPAPAVDCRLLDVDLRDAGSRAVRARSHHALPAWPASRPPAASRPRRCRPASHCRQHGPLDRGRG